MYLKLIERQPFALFHAPNLNLDTLSLRNIEHIMPFRLRNLHFDTMAIRLLLAIGRSETCHALFVLVSREHKVKRCYIVRHSDIAIIRKNGRQALSLLR